MGFFMFKTTILSILFLSVPLFSQELSHTYSRTSTLDDATASDTYYIYFDQLAWTGGLKGGGVKTDTTAGIKSPNVFNGKYLVTFYIDSLKAGTVLDSLWGYIRPIDKDKVPFGDSLYFDFTNNDTTLTGFNYLLNQVPFNRSASTSLTVPNGWVNISDILPPCHGVEVGVTFTQVAATDSAGFKLNHNLGLPK